MTINEVVAVWQSHGAPMRNSEWNVYCVRNGGGDEEIGSTPELMQTSERFETEKLTFTQPPATCASCNDPADGAAKWVEGHRPRWRICSECKTVYPHRDCYNISGGRHCEECGLKLRQRVVLQPASSNSREQGW
jgi:hypothetical protein